MVKPQIERSRETLVAIATSSCRRFCFPLCDSISSGSEKHGTRSKSSERYAKMGWPENHIRSVITAGLLLCAMPVVEAQETANVAQPSEKYYETREFHDPNGIGKFYMGREIAHVMGHQAAPWLERPEREQEERLSLLVKLLDLKPGDAVADIGAGSGVISELLSKQVGETGKVFAVDIQQEMLDRLQKRMNRLGISNVELVLGNERSPQLKPGSVDLAIMVDVYHEIEFPYEMVMAISQSLKPGGRIAFVEYRMEDPNVPIKLVHKMSEKQVKKEMEPQEFGLEWLVTKSELPRQHLILFQKPMNVGRNESTD